MKVSRAGLADERLAHLEGAGSRHVLTGVGEREEWNEWEHYGV